MTFIGERFEAGMRVRLDCEDPGARPGRPVEQQGRQVAGVRADLGDGARPARVKAADQDLTEIRQGVAPALGIMTIGVCSSVLRRHRDQRTRLRNPPALKVSP